MKRIALVVVLLLQGCSASVVIGAALVTEALGAAVAVKELTKSTPVQIGPGVYMLNPKIESSDGVQKL